MKQGGKKAAAVKPSEYKVETIEGKKKGRPIKARKAEVIMRETEENIEFAKLAKEDSEVFPALK